MSTRMPGVLIPQLVLILLAEQKVRRVPYLHSDKLCDLLESCQYPIVDYHIPVWDRVSLEWIR